MNQFISTNDLENTFAFLDNVFICGADQEDHDIRWNKFNKAAREHNFTFNEKKSVFSTTKLQMLGSIVENSTINPDAQCLQPLYDLPLPHDLKSMKMTVGLFRTTESGYQDFLIKFRY